METYNAHVYFTSTYSLAGSPLPRKGLVPAATKICPTGMQLTVLWLVAYLQKNQCVKIYAQL